MVFLEVMDSTDHALANREALDINRDYAHNLGVTAKMAIDHGFYFTDTGEKVDWSSQVAAARKATSSLSPSTPLPALPDTRRYITQVQVRNQTTMQAACDLIRQGSRPLALNFASGTNPGGGFLGGARAQEETLCRSSALHATLYGDPFYEHHRTMARDYFSDWAILSPNVPFFREDDGGTLEEPYLLSILTCAAPIAHRVGIEESRNLLRQRIDRVFHIATAHGYKDLVLGAWGCGAFGNDPVTTAIDFKNALENKYDGYFEKVIFAITDWSPERRFLGPFAKHLSPNGRA